MSAASFRRGSLISGPDPRSMGASRWSPPRGSC